MLEGYDSTTTDNVVSGFRDGFTINSMCKVFDRVPRNAKFVAENPEVIVQFIQAEVQAPRSISLLTLPPFKNFFVFPLGVKPVRALGEYRIVYDLSYPYDGVGTS